MMSLLQCLHLENGADNPQCSLPLGLSYLFWSEKGKAHEVGLCRNLWKVEEAQMKISRSLLGQRDPAQIQRSKTFKSRGGIESC